MFAIVWAWINFSWFASAFDTDDWFYRVTTMVQMIGVVVLALGLPRMFESLVEGERIHNEVMVAGCCSSSPTTPCTGCSCAPSTRCTRGS
ncbi:low temperature requirement protein A [Isoptericola variabilis]|uniref:low temperature requirement protein A n=1 Tax=Isoptericola variabilis TaxID=139208 RepID=UPI000674EDA7|nr:low temperature requirement protein A [Isoptericola variabilis]TWH27444.1 putative membrane protein [Isoptericola variabilis J7]